MLDWPRPGDRDRETTLKDGGGGVGGESRPVTQNQCVCWGGGGGAENTFFS